MSDENPGSALARKRWEKTTLAERLAHGRRLTDLRLAKRRKKGKASK